PDGVTLCPQDVVFKAGTVAAERVGDLHSVGACAIDSNPQGDWTQSATIVRIGSASVAEHICGHSRQYYRSRNLTKAGCAQVAQPIRIRDSAVRRLVEIHQSNLLPSCGFLSGHEFRTLNKGDSHNY